MIFAKLGQFVHVIQFGEIETVQAELVGPVSSISVSQFATPTSCSCKRGK